MKIKIIKQSLKENSTVVIDTEKRTFKTNKCKGKEIYENQLLTVIKHISSWKESLVNNNILDGTIYTIKIKSDSGIKEIVFKNKYPKNFTEFISVLGELKDAK